MTFCESHHEQQQQNLGLVYIACIALSILSESTTFSLSFLLSHIPVTIILPWLICSGSLWDNMDFLYRTYTAMHLYVVYVGVCICVRSIIKTPTHKLTSINWTICILWDEKSRYHHHHGRISFLYGWNIQHINQIT